MWLTFSIAYSILKMVDIRWSDFCYRYCISFICTDHIFSIKVCPFVLTNSRLQISLKDFSLFCPSLQFSEALCQNLDFLYKHLEFLHINDPHFQYPSADRLVIINIAVFWLNDYFSILAVQWNYCYIINYCTT